MMEGCLLPRPFVEECPMVQPTRWVWMLALTLVALPPLAAQDKTGAGRPVWKGFDELNKPFWLEQKADTVQNMKIMGVEVAQKQTQTVYVKLTPRRKGD